MEKKFLTKANRDAEISKITVSKNPELRSAAKRNGLPHLEWMVAITYRNVFGKEWSTVVLFRSETEAREFATELESTCDEVQDFTLRQGVKEQVELRFDPDGKGQYVIAKTLFDASGDAFMHTNLSVLHAVGVLDAAYDLTAEVHEYLGLERINWLKKFGPNWEVLAELDYCLLQFPVSSIAVLAAKQRFHYYFSGDDFNAGYLARDVELLLDGVEQSAKSVLEAQRKRAEGGGRSSRAASIGKLEAYMQEIEKLGDLYPRMSEAAIVDQAFQNAAKNNKTFWKTGGGQAEKYAVRLRSENGFKERYYSIFSQSA